MSSFSSTYNWQDIYSPSFKLPSESQKQKLPSPPGYNPTSSSSTKNTQSTKSTSTRNISLEKLKIQKSWEYSYSPLKNLPMNLIMSYFSPNTLQLIPIIMTLNLFLTPFKEIFNGMSRFDDMAEDVEPTDLIMMKICFVASWICNLGVGVWKLNQMGLIPNTKSDWLSWEVAQTYIERT